MFNDSSSELIDNKPRLVEKYLYVFLIIISAVIIFFLGQLLAILFTVAGLQLVSGPDTSVSTLVSESNIAVFGLRFLISAVTVGLLYGLYAYNKSSFIKGVGLDRRPTSKDVLVTAATFAAYTLALFIILPIVSALFSQVDLEQTQQLGFSSIQGFDLVLIFLLLVIVVPVAEEILFRGYLYRKLRGRVSVRVAAIITSILFAVAHLEFSANTPLNWAAAADTLILSGFLIYLVERYKSLWPAIFLHSTKNAVAFILLFIL